MRSFGVCILIFLYQMSLILLCNFQKVQLYSGYSGSIESKGNIRIKWKSGRTGGSFLKHTMKYGLNNVITA